MIIVLLFNLIVLIIGSIFSLLLPQVTIATIPYIGQQLHDILVSMFSMWNAFMITFPYAVFAWHILLFIVIPFEIAMLTLRFFLGSHVPTN